MKHRTIRENDEYACSCGLRWDVKEPDPHEPSYRPVRGDQLKDTRTGYVTYKPWRNK